MTLAEAARRYGIRRDRLKRAALEGRLRVDALMGARRTALYLVEPAEVERFMRESKRGPKPRRKEGGDGNRP